MPISYRGENNTAGQAAGTTTTASTVSITPTLPVNAISGDRIFVVAAADNTSGTTPTNWTVVGGSKDIIVGSGAVAAGSGQRYISVYYRDYDETWSMPAFTLTSLAQNSHWIGAIALSKSSSDSWDTPTISTAGSDFGTANTAHSATTGSLTTHTNGYLIIGSVENDNVTMTTGALSQTGATFGTVVERADGGTATGFDVSGKVHTCPVTAGASAALTFTGTLSASSQGGTVVVEQTVTPSGWAGPIFAGQGQWIGQTGRTAFNVPIPRDVVADDIILVYMFLASAAGTSVTVVPSGFTEVPSTPISSAPGDGSQGTLRVYWKRATGSEPATYDFTLSPSTVSAGFALKYKGCTTSGSPIDADNSAGISSTSANFANVSLTTTGADRLLVWAGYSWDGLAYTLPTGFSFDAHGKTDDSEGGQGMASKTQASSGSTGTLSGSVATTDSAKASWLGALKSTESLLLEVSPVDLVGLTDSITTQQDWVQTPIDLVGLTDAAAIVQDWVRTQTDIAGITDAATVQQDWVRTPTDLIGLTDTATFTLTTVTDFTPAPDLIGLTDTVVVAQDYVRTLTDTVGVTDAVIVQQDWVRTQTDFVGLTDSLVIAVTRTVTDNVGATDSFVTTQDYVAALTDTVGVTDLLTLGLTRTVTDTVSLTDAVIVIQDWVRTLVDTVSLTDILALQRLVTPIDLVGLIDATTIVQDWARTQTDLLGLTDVLTKDVGRTPVDLTGLTDTVAVTQDWVRSPVDPVDLTDTATFVLAGAGQISVIDQAGITDLLTTAMAVVKVFTDTAGITDVLIKDAGCTQVDPVGLTDTVTVVVSYVQSVVDSVGIIDSAIFSLAGASAVTAADIVEVTDTAGFVISRSLASAFAGSGTVIADVLSSYALASGLGGSGLLAATVDPVVLSNLTGAGTLTAIVELRYSISAALGGAGLFTASRRTLGAPPELTPPIAAVYVGALPITDIYLGDTPLWSVLTL